MGCSFQSSVAKIALKAEISHREEVNPLWTFHNSMLSAMTPAAGHPDPRGRELFTYKSRRREYASIVRRVTSGAPRTRTGRRVVHTLRLRMEP